MKDKKWSMIIGRNIDDRRRELGLTHYRLGELVGVGGKLIGRWCQGRHLPNVVALYRMSKIFGCSMEDLMEEVEIFDKLPSAQPDHDIPRKPKEAYDFTWGKKTKEAGCPNCDYFLNRVEFLGDGKRVTYCEHCGQAIDWEGWEWDETD